MRNKGAEKILIKKIKDYQNIIIAKHKNPDWDAQGSALGLANIINNNFSKKNIWVVGDRLDDDNSFSMPGKLSDKVLSKTLLITVDTANKERVDFGAIDKVSEIFKIDHHIIVEKYEDENMVDPDAASCTELITLWAEWNGLDITELAASYLYKGLITDSGRFLYSATSPNTFLCAQVLLKKGLNIQDIYNDLYLQDLKLKKWQNSCFKKAKFTKKGIAYIVVKHSDYKNLNFTQEQIKSGLSTISGLKDYPIFFFVAEQEEGEIKVSIRSWKYNIQQVAVNYNGGGHAQASGAKLSSFDDVKNLIKDLENIIE